MGKGGGGGGGEQSQMGEYVWWRGVGKVTLMAMS